MHTAHGGQLARFVGSPVTFVALTATADKANSKEAETARIVLVLCDYGQGEEGHSLRRCCYKRARRRTGLFRNVIPFTWITRYLYILISCGSSIEASTQ